MSNQINDAELAQKMMKAMFKLRMSAASPHGCGHHFGNSDEMPPERPPMPPFGRGMGHGPHGKGGPRPMGRERILLLIDKYPDGVHQKDILDEAHINPSSLSELIDKLESDGYIERKTDPADKRATLLFLTDKGKARAAEVEDEQAGMFKDYFKNLTEEEKQTLSDLLDKLLA